MKSIVSLFQSKQWILGLTPDQGCLVRLGGADHTVLMDVEHQFLVSPEQDAKFIEQLVAKAERGVALDLVLSDDWVRFAVIPPLPGGHYVALADMLCIAHDRLERLYGDMQGWQCVVDRPRYGLATLACALPVAWADMIATVAKARRCRIRGCRPAFAQAWNRLVAPQHASGAVAFVLRGAQGLTVGVFHAQPSRVGWTVARHLRIADGVDRADVVRQELIVAGESADMQQVWVSLVPDSRPSGAQGRWIDLSQSGRLSEGVALARLGGA